MSSELLSSPDCCGDTCCEAETTQIPGPQGPAGADGTNGSDGNNAYDTLAAGFVMPAEGGDVTITVTNTTDWMAPSQGSIEGQMIFIEFAGYLEVRSITNATQAVVRNRADVAVGEYPDNASPGANIPLGATLSPGGLQGPVGPTEAGALLSVNNLSDVANVADSRDNLGLGDLAIQDTVNNDDWSGTDLAVANGGTGASSAAAARSNLGAAASGLATASGLTVSTGERILGKASGAPAGAVEEIVCTSFAQSLLDDATAAAARATLGVAAAGGAYAFSAIQTAPQGFANITNTQVEFGATEYDDDGVWDTTNDEYTAPADGLYFFSAQVIWAGFAGAVEMSIQFQVNTVVVSEYVLDVESNAAGDAGIQLTDILSLQNGDVLQVWASQTSGSGESTDDTASRTRLRGYAIFTS